MFSEKKFFNFLKKRSRNHFAGPWISGCIWAIKSAFFWKWAITCLLWEKFFSKNFTSLIQVKTKIKMYRSKKKSRSIFFQSIFRLARWLSRHAADFYIWILIVACLLSGDNVRQYNVFSYASFQRYLIIKAS